MMPPLSLSSLFAALLVAVVPVSRISAQAARTLAAGAMSDSLLALVASARHPDMRYGRLTDVEDDLRRAYEATGWTPLWLRDGRPTAQARAIVTRLAGVEDIGLPPVDFDAPRLDSALAALSSVPDNGGRGARFDAMLSADVARLVRALEYGRISPGAAHATLDFRRESFDADVVLREVAGASDPVARVAAVEPRYQGYRLLKQMLARYRTLARDSSLLPLPPIPARVLRPGMAWQGTASLRRLLVALQDLPPSAASGPDTLYAAAIVDGVRRFQERNGLSADGEIGPTTFQRLNRPWDNRVRQIELTLERWRWLPREFPVPPLVVNIPEFRLRALDSMEGDAPAAITMDVAVGKAYDTSTPVFMADLTHLIFSPYWEVPTSIMRNEIRPNAVRDPSYLTRNRYQIVSGWGDDPRVLPVNTANAARIGSGAVRVRQLPGDRNSLGRVKFMLPNKYNIYLHDTPSKGAFAQARRDVSHGCIRLADPVRLAEWLLRDRPRWTRAAIDSAMSRTTPLRVDLPQRIPVLVVYGTAVATQDGEMRFADDIYGHDRRLRRLLDAGFPYPR